MVPGGFIKILGLFYIGFPKELKMKVVVPRKKRNNTITATKALVNTIRAKRIVMKDVQKVLGNAAYICCSQRSRSGSIVMRLIYPWTVETTFHRLKRDRGARRKLIVAMAMLMVLVEFRDPIIITEDSANAQFTYIFTDASTNGANAPPLREAPRGHRDLYTRFIAIGSHLPEGPRV